MPDFTRKEFLRASLLGGTAAMLAPRLRAGETGPAAAPAIARTRSANEEVRVAIVGINDMGATHIDHFARLPNVRVVALCDCDGHVLARRAAETEKRWYKPETFADFRSILDRRDIDAVVVATPNHWHSLMSVWACQAGKDVYLEKPISHNIWEGRQAVTAAQKYQRIVQTGTQNRSAKELQAAHDFIWSGKLGRVLWARGLCYNRRDSLGHTSGPQPVPSYIDYDRWSGPAPLVPSRRNGPRGGPVHYDWHWFWNYGGGDIANQGVHQMDICRWFLNEPGLPPTAFSLGGRLGYRDDGQTPNTMIAVFNYEKAPLIFEVRGLPMRAGMRAMDSYRGARVGVVVQCEHGYFAPGETGGGAVYDNHGRKIAAFTGPGGGAHHQNFIDAVRSRDASKLAASIEVGHASSSLSHLANISYRLGRETPNEAIRGTLAENALAVEAFGRLEKHLAANNVDVAKTPLRLGPTLQLEPGAERFVSAGGHDDGYWANTMLRREYRPPFVVPEQV